MEPAAELVAAFNVHVGRPRSRPFACSEHSEVAGAGVKPDVENVGLFAERGAAALGALVAGAHEFGGRFGIPNVGGVLAELRDDAIEYGFVGKWLGAAFAIENSDGHAPDALA